MHFNLLEFLKSNYLLILSLLGVFILYIILDKIFGKKKELKNEDEEELEVDENILKIDNKKTEEKNPHKKKTGYTSKSSSYYSYARNYSYIPKDGSAVRGGEYRSTKHIKPKNVNRNDELEETFKEIFYTKMPPTISGCAMDAKLSNDEFLKKLKEFKKKGLFLDVKPDEFNDKMVYANEILDRSEEVFYTEEKSVDSIVQKLDNGMIIHKCPFCNTDNILSNDTKNYKCYYCLKDVNI